MWGCGGGSPTFWHIDFIAMVCDGALAMPGPQASAAEQSDEGPEDPGRPFL